MQFTLAVPWAPTLVHTVLRAQTHTHTRVTRVRATEPVLVLASWPEVNQIAPSLFTRTQKAHCSESSRRKNQRARNNSCSLAPLRNLKLLQSSLRPGVSWSRSTSLEGFPAGRVCSTYPPLNITDGLATSSPIKQPFWEGFLFWATQSSPHTTPLQVARSEQDFFFLWNLGQGIYNVDSMCPGIWLKYEPKGWSSISIVPHSS